MSTQRTNSITPRWLILMAVVFSCAFSGCAIGTLARDAQASGSIVPRGGKGRVVVYRTPGIAGVGTNLYVFADEKLIGGLGRKMFYSYDAAPGPVELSFSYRPHKRTAFEWVADGFNSGGLLMAALTQSSEVRKRGNITVFLRANETQYVRIDGHRLTPVSSSQGQAEMSRCHWQNEFGSPLGPLW